MLSFEKRSLFSTLVEPACACTPLIFVSSLSYGTSQIISIFNLNSHHCIWYSMRRICLCQHVCFHPSFSLHSWMPHRCWLSGSCGCEVRPPTLRWDSTSSRKCSMITFVWAERAVQWDKVPKMRHSANNVKTLRSCHTLTIHETTRDINSGQGMLYLWLPKLITKWSCQHDALFRLNEQVPIRIFTCMYVITAPYPDL